MSSNDIVVPIALSETRQCTITPPWFVQNTEYPPALATYKPLVNGEETFAAVHHAIARATKSVDIICWGFQPSMYFIRDGRSPCIGELLVSLAREKGVMVRILGWEFPFNATGYIGEANLPGKGVFRYKDRAGQSATEKQYAYDQQWFASHSYGGEWDDVLIGSMGIPGKVAQRKIRNKKVLTDSPLFVGRGFDVTERVEIAYQAARRAADPELSIAVLGTLASTASHHQKTVLVDYELPERAVGFVMGHNMLDEYWDTDAHSSQRRAGSAGAWQPDEGPRGFLPRQDISCQVTGPILEHLHENFARAWHKVTLQDLMTLRNAKAVAEKLTPRPEYGTSLMAQLLRTQAQEGKRDIERLYLQTVKNATQFIYIENQYFRWPPLAEAVKEAALAQTRAGRDPGQHGALHVFVVTNVTDDGIGSGTVNTQRMLDSLGRADTIPGVTKALMIKALDKPARHMVWLPGLQKLHYYQQEQTRRREEYQQKVKEIQEMTILPETRPGLKIHVCSLVAPDSPPGDWMPVYIHSKLMIINDVFTTHGSANINTRSMQVDSEMNIAHEWISVTQDLRRRLWALHTGGEGAQDNASEAFDKWGDLMKKNQDNQEEGRAPRASLIPFRYNNPTLRDLD
ncbi:phosphatidylserine/phosphatidylglycerophosphate/cardiolipin synthase family protein [Enterobacteriaceae bacterium LUAb1]